MSTKREQIMQAVMTRLATVPGVTSVERTREDAMAREESPAIAARWTDELVVREAVPYTDKALDIEVYVYARGTPPDQVADAAVRSAHAALMGEPTLGGLAIDISEAGSSLEADEADLTAAGVTMRYRVQYRHQRANLAA